MTDQEHHVFEALYARRSVRNYLDKPVERQRLVKLLKAAMAAPSACNCQPWEFIVVTAPETVAEVKGTVARWGDWNAPAIIVVCGLPDLIPWEDDGKADCCAAIENMLVAATAMGLGTVWIGGADREQLKAVLDIPERVVPIGVVYLGYPAETPEPRTQYLENAVHWGKYDTTRVPEPRKGKIV